MKLAFLAFAVAFALSNSFAQAQTANPKPVAKVQERQQPNNGNPNGNPNGPTTLSGTGSSSYGGSSPGTSGRN